MLLKAALLKDASAISGWQSWKKHVEFENVGEADKRLFPLVYHNLQTLQYTDEFTEALRISHRRSFRDVTLLLQKAAALTSRLKENGIRTILLKGAALSIHYYPSIALRPMSDIDIMIRPEHFSKAVKILTEQNWYTHENNLGLIFEIIHSCQFLNSENTELDLHWRLMRDCWNADKNEVFWESAIPLNYKLLVGETLCATDQLFHVCCHGARYNSIAPIRWVADALMILRSPFVIEWQRLYTLSKIYRFSFLLLHALSYLKETYGAAIPDSFLQQLERVPQTRLEKMSFYLFSQHRQRWTVWRFIQEAAFQYSSLRSSTELRPRSLVFIKYLRHFLTVEKISKKLSPPA